MSAHVFCSFYTCTFDKYCDKDAKDELDRNGVRIYGQFQVVFGVYNE